MKMSKFDLSKKKQHEINRIIDWWCLRIKIAVVAAVAKTKWRTKKKFDIDNPSQIKKQKTKTKTNRSNPDNKTKRNENANANGKEQKKNLKFKIKQNKKTIDDDVWMTHSYIDFGFFRFLVFCSSSIFFFLQFFFWCLFDSLISSECWVQEKIETFFFVWKFFFYLMKNEWKTRNQKCREKKWKKSKKKRTNDFHSKNEKLLYAIYE